MTDNSMVAGMPLEGGLENKMELEKPLLASAEAAASEKREQPPASLEAVRLQTARTMKSGLEFWQSPLGGLNGDTEFMSAQNGDRREMLKHAFEVIADQAAFGDPQALVALREKLNGEVEDQVGAPGVVEGDDIVDASVANVTADHDSESQDVGVLQEEILSIVHELFFEQLFADLFQCREEINARKSQAAQVLSADVASVSSADLQATVDLFEQFQIDSNMLDQYLAHGQALMDISTRSLEIGANTKNHLEEIVQAYANATASDTLAPTLQIAGETGDPNAYFRNEREKLQGRGVFVGVFTAAVDRFKAAIAQLETNNTAVAQVELEEATAELQDAVASDQPEATAPTAEPDLEPVAEAV
ncbi:hypothetical protein KA012_03085 [Candidatus Woesebacteria bacterium]|nr:hypothetical protein [Candidatus Woesebacteria bacterium]